MIWRIICVNKGEDNIKLVAFGHWQMYEIITPLLGVFSYIHIFLETIAWKLGRNHYQRLHKVHLWLSYVAQKHRCLSSLMWKVFLRKKEKLTMLINNNNFQYLILCNLMCNINTWSNAHVNQIKVHTVNPTNGPDVLSSNESHKIFASSSRLFLSLAQILLIAEVLCGFIWVNNICWTKRYTTQSFSKTRVAADEHRETSWKNLKSCQSN